jgi:microcystin degradation protein MlrC
MTAFRTAPHRDEEETCRRALALLVQALVEGLRPVPVMVKPPLLLVGEKAMTDYEPAKSLYSRLGEIDAVPGIIDSSLLIGCAYTDSLSTSTSVIVVAERDAALARRQADALAREVWDRRQEFEFGLETAPVDDAIWMAMQSSEMPVFITDSGDNVTAGGAGNTALVLERLLALGVRDALVAGIADAAAVARCTEAGVDTQVDISIGGKLDTAYSAPLTVTGIVENLGEVGKGNVPQTALLRVGGVRVILTRRRRVFENIDSITSCGIDPMKQKIVVVKLGYLYPDLQDCAPRAIMAISPGSTNLNVEELPYRKLQRPIFPLDGDLEWEP